MPAIWRRCAFGLAAAAGLAALTAAPAAAADFAQQWEVGAYLVQTIYDNDSTISDTLGWGVRGGYHFKPQHGVELIYDIESADESSRVSTGTFDITKATVNYVHDLKTKKPDAKVGAFLLFGGGKMLYDKGDDSESATLLQTGGGVRVKMTKHIALRFDGKVFHYHGDSVLIPRDGFFGFDIDAGVSFFFGPGS